MKIECFISYCYDKIDRIALDFFIKQLKDKRQFPDIVINYDLEAPTIRNWDSYIDKIMNSHIVIIFCSPMYKEKIINHQNGVHKEFIKITEKYFNALNEAELKIKDYEDKFSISDICNFDLIPIILQGNKDTSVPKMIIDNNIRFHDFSNYTYTQIKEKGKVRTEIIKSQLNSFNQDLKKIKARVELVKKFHTGGYIENYLEQWNRLRIDELFKQTKANFNDVENVKSNFHNTLFVKTYSFKQAAVQSKYIFIGRKGSGKSALLQVASQKLKRHFSYIIPIERTNMDIIELNNVFNDEIISDSNYLSKRVQIFSYSWRLFIRLLLVENIIIDFFISKKNGSDKYEVFEKQIEDVLIKQIEKIVNSNFNKYLELHPELSKRNHYFVFSFSNVLSYLKKCIQEARPEPEYFFSDIECHFNYNEILNFVLSEKVNLLIESIIKYTRKKVLITFDDADSYFNTKYLETQTKENLHKFEIDFLYGLLSFANDVKQIKKGDSLAKYFDFVIAVSSDHLFEILSFERDSYRLEEYYSVISWTGVELALMLRKRLCVAFNYSISKSHNTSVKDTLVDVLKNKLKFLPQTIHFSLDDGVKYEMHIFLYILRFTFWRPRDILRYFAKLLVYIHEQYDMKTKLDTETVRLIVRKSTRDVIESEFINEYDGYIVNIEDVIHCFDGCDQVFFLDEFEKRLMHTPIILSLDYSKIHSTLKKVKYLYQIGFLGIYATPEIQLAQNLKSDTAFIFNEGADIVNSLNETTISQYFYTIHPIFQSYLHLKMDKSRLLLNYTWAYLEEMEDIMTSSNHNMIVKF